MTFDKIIRMMTKQFSTKASSEVLFFDFTEFHKVNLFERRSQPFYEWFLGFAEGDGCYLSRFVTDKRHSHLPSRQKVRFHLTQKDPNKHPMVFFYINFLMENAVSILSALIIIFSIRSLSSCLSETFPDNWKYIHRERLLISLSAILLAIIGMINIPLLVSKIQQFFSQIFLLIKVEGWESAFSFFLSDSDKFNTALISSLNYPVMFLVVWVAFLLYSFSKFYYVSRSIILVVLLTFSAFALNVTKLQVWCMLYPGMQVIYLALYIATIMSFIKCYNVARYKNILAIGLIGIISLFFPLIKGGLIEPLLSLWPCVEAQGSGSSSPMSTGSDMSEDEDAMNESALQSLNVTACTAGEAKERTTEEVAAFNSGGMIGQGWEAYFFPPNAEWVTTVNIAVEVDVLGGTEIGIISNYAYKDPLGIRGVTSLDPRGLPAIQLLMVEAKLCTLAELEEANKHFDDQVPLCQALPAIESILHRFESDDWRFLTPILNLDATLGDRLANDFTYLFNLPIGKYGSMYIPLRMYIANWLDYNQGNNTIPLIIYGKPEGWFGFSPEFSISTNRPSSDLEPAHCYGGASVYEALIPSDGIFALDSKFRVDKYRFVGLYELEEFQLKSGEFSFGVEKVRELLNASQNPSFDRFLKSPDELLLDIGMDSDKLGVESKTLSLNVCLAKKNELGKAEFFNNPLSKEGMPRIPAYFRADQNLIASINHDDTSSESLDLYEDEDVTEYKKIWGSSSSMWVPDSKDLSKGGTIIKLNKADPAFIDYLSSDRDEGSSPRTLTFTLNGIIGHCSSELGMASTEDLSWEETFESMKKKKVETHPDFVETTSPERGPVSGLVASGNRTPDHKAVRGL